MINHFVALTDHCVGRCGLYSKKQGVWVEPVQEKEQREELPLNDNSFRVNCNRQRNRGMKKQNKPSKMHTHTHRTHVQVSVRWRAEWKYHVTFANLCALVQLRAWILSLVKLQIYKKVKVKNARTNKNQTLYNLKQNKINTDGKNLVHYKKANEHPHSLRFSSFTLSSTDVSPNHKHNLTNRGKRKIQERTNKQNYPSAGRRKQPNKSFLIHWT